MSAPLPTDVSPPRPTAVAIVGTDLVLAAFPATPVQIAHALQRLGFDVVVPASWGDELLAAATLASLEERGGVPVVYCACPRVAERLLATGSDLAPVLLPLVTPPVAAARYVRAAYATGPVTVTYFGGCCSTADASIDARITPREFLRTLHDRDIALAEMPRVFEGIIPPDRRRHLSLPGGLPDTEQLASLSVPRGLACLTSADYAAELAQLVLAREPVVIDVAARLGCACVGATTSTPFDRAHETVTRLEPPRAPYAVVDSSLVSALDAPLPEAPTRFAPRAEHRPSDTTHGARTSTPPRAMPAYGAPASPRPLAQHTPPSQSRYPAGEPNTGATRRKSAVTGFFRGVGSAEQPPRARTGEGTALPRAYVSKRRGAGDGGRNSGETARTSGERDMPTGERELPIARHIEPVLTPTPPAMPAFVVPPAVSPLLPEAAPALATAHPAASAPPHRTTAAVPRAIATPVPSEVSSAAHAAFVEPPTRAVAPPPSRALPAVAGTPTPSRLRTVMPPSSTATVAPDVFTPVLPAPAPMADASPVQTSAPDAPSWAPTGSGRELLFFVAGALLGVLIYVMFR